MNIAICDDEKLFIDQISSYLLTTCAKHNKNCNIVTCNRGDSLIDLYQKDHFDAVFLDISMPGINGFETAEKLLELRKNSIIIFVSSKESMVFSSYEYKPFWFVPKSQISMLEIVINKLIKKLDQEANESTLVSLTIESNKVIEINLKELAYFRTADHYLNIVNKDKSISASYRTKLDPIDEQLLSRWFVRTHSRYLVNCRMISTIEKSCCVLINGEQVPISRSHMTQTKEIFQAYMRSIR